MSKVAAKCHRILLPLDLSRDSLSALAAAFDLAVGMGAEVSGLFVEDTQLLSAGSLPLAREVGFSSGISRSIGPLDIDKAFRSVAGRARDVLAQTSQRVKVRSSFRVARGDVAAEILAASSEADLLVIGKVSCTIGGFRKLGSTCTAILTQSHIPVLIVEEGTTLSPPIIAVHDGSDAGRRALDFARNLSHILGWEIVVFSAQDMATTDDVLERIRHEKSNLFVLPATLPLTECTSRLRSPVFFVP
jgi:nucleotide-binding universal stress UspA family protein